MKHDLLALRPVASISGLCAAVLLLLWGLVALDMTQYIVPSPHVTAEQFLRALKAHRYEGARDQLSEGLRAQVSRERLAQVVQDLERTESGISEAHGERSQQSGTRADAEAQVRLESQREVVLTFPLVREQGIWRITSVDPLDTLRPRR
jgi:hypothetical protein